jgi:hypothetical protein
MTNTNLGIDESNFSNLKSEKNFSDFKLEKFLDESSYSKNLVLQENLARYFSFYRITKISFLVTIYWIVVWFYSIYRFIEVCALKLNIFFIVSFRVLIINFFLTKIRFVFFIFSSSLSFILLEIKFLLLKYKCFLILSSLKKLQKNFYYFFLNFSLEIITLKYTINKFYVRIVTNKFVLAFLFLVAFVSLITKFYFLILKVYRLFLIL